MAFCLQNDERRERLTRPELIAKFGAVAGEHIFGRHYRTRYYLDMRDRDEGIVRLSLMIPDLGAHPRRLVRKVRREIEKRRASGGWLHKLIQARLFSVTVLTAFPAKARQLEANLQRETFHFRVELVPGYGDLLGLMNTGESE